MTPMVLLASALIIVIGVGLAVASGEHGEDSHILWSLVVAALGIVIFCAVAWGADNPTPAKNTPPPTPAPVTPPPPTAEKGPTP